MARTRIIAAISGADGVNPVTLTFSSNDPCAPITFRDPQSGETGSGTIQITATGPTAWVWAEYENDDCVDHEGVLDTISVSADNGECMALAEKEVNDPCFRYAGLISAQSVSNNEQTLIASTSLGNTPLLYSWEVTSGSAFILGSSTGQSVRIDRSDLGAAVAQVTIIDANQCEVVSEISLPAVSENPVFESVSRTLVCGDDQYEPIYFDVMALASDPDGELDYSTLEFTTSATKGTESWDANTRLITYDPDNAETGTDFFVARIKDNNGNWSNLATFHIQLTPCLALPVATQDTISTDCETAVDITVTDNDTDSDSDIDPDSVRLISTPMNGVAISQGNGVIRYTPVAGFEGVDVIRYYITDADGNDSLLTSTLGTIIITIGACCDNHSAGLEFTCGPTTGDDFEIDAANTGTVNGIDTDLIEVQLITDEVAGGFSSSSNIELTMGCSPSSDYYINDGDGYTDASGFFASGTDSYLTITPLVGNQFKLECVFEDPIPLGMAQEIQDYIDDCQGEVIQLSNTDNDQPYRFLTQFMNNFVINENGFEFYYNTGTNASICDATVNAYVSASHTYLDGLAGPTTVDTWELILVECRTFGATYKVQFRRTIERDNGCDDIVLLYEYEFNANDPNACENMEFTLVSATNPGTGPAYDKNDYDVLVDDPTEITAVTVNSSNILTETYDFPDDVVALQTAIQNWLDANDEGIVEVYNAKGDGEQLIIQVARTTATFNSVTTDAGTDNFTSR